MTTNDDAHANPEKPVWLITGCSTGLGRELAKVTIGRGYRVVVTTRKPEAAAAIAGGAETVVLPLDVTDQAQVDGAIKLAEAKFGHIDVLVNNAGVGYFGAVDESAEEAANRMFAVNVFGLSRMIRAVLPGMRRRRRGSIVNFSSFAGLRAFPADGCYSATKSVVEGMSETLWQETETLGLHVLLVEPRGFHTDWEGQSAGASAGHVDDPAATAGVWRPRIPDESGEQPGDLLRAAQAVVHAVEAPNPPHRLFLGNQAVDAAKANLEPRREEFAQRETGFRPADGLRLWPDRAAR